MPELILTRIDPNNSELLQEFLSAHPYMSIFFFSTYALQTWVNHDHKALYIAELGSEKVLTIHKEKDDDVRVLFDHPSDEMIKALQTHFKTKYFAVNDVLTKPDRECFEGMEYEILLEPIAKLSDADIRKKYNQALRKNTGLVYEKYTPAHVPGIKVFLEKWNTTRSELFNKYAKTWNDVRFLDVYAQDPSVIGGVVLDKGEVVAYTLCAPSLNGGLCAMFNKVLRGYTELGVFIYVERARQLLEAGFTKVQIGSVNNEFKKKWLDGAVETKVYGYVVQNELKLRNPEMWARMVF